MKMKIFLFLALYVCAYAAEVKEAEKSTPAATESASSSSSEPSDTNKDKRQTDEGFVPSHFIYRPPRKQEQVAPVEEPQEEDKDSVSSRVDNIDNEEYRPGQVFSLNPQELLELQPERKAPLPSSAQLQQLYNNPQPDHRQNLQQIYYLEPQTARQVGQPAINVISPVQNALPPHVINTELHQLYSNAQPFPPQLNATRFPQLNSTQHILQKLQEDIRLNLQQLYYIRPKNGASTGHTLEGLFEIEPALKTAPIPDEKSEPLLTTKMPSSFVTPDSTANPTTQTEITTLKPDLPKAPATVNEQQENITQVALQPSHAVIARPSYSSNGGEASVGAALSVSDSGVGASDSFDQELLALLGQSPFRQQEAPQTYQQQVQASTQSVAPQYQQISASPAPQYQQVDRYITKPSKKPSKLRPKVHTLVSPPQSSAAPQQYLIETTNVQQQQQPVAYRPAPQPQPQPQQPRPTQALRYVPVPTAQAFLQQALYERPEAQGLKVVAAPNLQQARPALAYRFLPQYPQPEASPKQYRIVEAPRPQQQQQRVPASSIERPVTYLKRFPEPEKMRAVKIYDPVPQEALAPQQPAQFIGEQYYLRPVYRTNDQRGRYELTPLGIRTVEQPRAVEPSKPPHSSIYVSQKVAPKKAGRQHSARVDQTKFENQREQSVRVEQPSSVEQLNIEQHGQSLEEQRSQLPPPKNNRAYTPEEFAALVAAGYAVTPIPVAPLGAVAQSRSSLEPAPAPPRARPLYSRRNPYLPLRADDAP